MNVAVIVLATAYGAAAGTLLPRLRHRLSVAPGETWRSTWPCGHAIDGWLGRPRCGICDEGFAAITPWSLATALVGATLTAAAGPHPESLVWLLIAPAGVLLGGIDQAVRRLPDVLTLPLAAGTPVLLGAAARLPGAAGSWTGAVAGALALGGGYFTLFLIRPDGIGFGDVKLAIGLGCALGWYGWPALFLGAFTGMLLGALRGMTLLLFSRTGPKFTLAFGPFMLLGAWAGVIAGGMSG